MFWLVIFESLFTYIHYVQLFIYDTRSHFSKVELINLSILHKCSDFQHARCSVIDVLSTWLTGHTSPLSPDLGRRGVASEGRLPGVHGQQRAVPGAV